MRRYASESPAVRLDRRTGRSVARPDQREGRGGRRAIFGHALRNPGLHMERTVPQDVPPERIRDTEICPCISRGYLNEL